MEQPLPKELLDWMKLCRESLDSLRKSINTLNDRMDANEKYLDSMVEKLHDTKADK
jgi:hypothetical protein